MTQKNKRIEWKERYEAWKVSGQSIAEWCRDQEIKDHQIYYWVQQFERDDSMETPVETQWLAVQVDEEPLPSSGQSPILLHFGVISVEVRPGANMSLLSDVVHVLQSQCWRTSFERVYLARGNTDLRKSIGSLVVIVKECFELDPFSPCLFVFCNRKRDKLKILQWEHNGFWLHYRRLERGTFHWPSGKEVAPMNISPRQLLWLLDGLPIEQKQAHREVTARTIL